MPLFLNTRGKSTLGIGICARCSRKMSLTELHPDPNANGLMVCRFDLDMIDPYRLAPRETEDISLRYARPDVGLYPGPTQYPVDQIQAAVGVNSSSTTRQATLGTGILGEAIEASEGAAIAAGPEEIFTVLYSPGIMGVEEDTIEGVAADVPVTQVNVSQPWSANTAYVVGDSVTNGDPVGMDAVGMTFYTFTCIVSGVSSATPPTWTINTGTPVVDNTVIWLNAGLYLP